ncbi:MAG: phosphoenolpyruvate synthase [Magnetococcales bacterium]|nr:phosphoenolpyruvate synthase [Magnetococcales bacterium]
MTLVSDALATNTAEMNRLIGKTVLPVEYQQLRVPVQHLSGVQQELDKLLHELAHPWINWSITLEELRSFVLRSCGYYLGHEQGPACCTLFMECFFRAIQAIEPSGSSMDPLRRAALAGITDYLDKLVRNLSQQQFPLYTRMLDRVIWRLADLPDRLLICLAQSGHRSILTVVLKLLRRHDTGSVIDQVTVRTLAVRLLKITYRYWLDQTDPAVLITSVRSIGHRYLLGQLRRLVDLERSAFQVITFHYDEEASLVVLQDLLAMPDHLAIIGHYREETKLLQQKRDDIQHLRFLFHVLEIDGLRLIHEETLKEINRVLIQMVQQHQGLDELRELFLRTFRLLNDNVRKYPHTALQCIEFLGLEVFRRNDDRLVEMFLELTVRFGFQYSMVSGVGMDWKPIANPAHLDNIRVWLNLIVRHPRWCSTLLSALIINLKLTGTCIRDTDLFQKEVTRLLNSDIRLVANLVRQFARLLPVYFNDIGAEGELRLVSTELDDTLAQRQDHLIHFLRKQCHVESSNLIVDLVRGIILYWHNGDSTPLHACVPQEILTRTPPSGPLFDGVHQVMQQLFEQIPYVEHLLTVPIEAIAEQIDRSGTGSANDRRRVVLLIQMFHLLHRKYHLEHHGVEQIVRQIDDAQLPDKAQLLELLSGRQDEDETSGLEILLNTLESLQRIILSDNIFPVHETIHRKRHIAVGIPSVYGAYQEQKFDALTLSFRLENLVNLYLERLIFRIPEDFITRATCFRALKYSRLFLRALAIDGITSRKLQSHLMTLQQSLDLAPFSPFSFKQYQDIFRGFAEALRDVIYTHYTCYHRDNLVLIIPAIPRELLLPGYARLYGHDMKVTIERVQEQFMRDLMAQSLGLQSFDRFISRIQRTLERQQTRLDPRGLNLLMTYDPAKLFCPIHHPSPYSNNPVHLGNKGFNLVQLAALGEGGCVPEGVVVTTEFFRCRQIIRHYPPAWEDFLERLRAQIHTIEQGTGTQFGLPDRPLLLSVRSGALISMPGMMQTILNVGMNESIVAGLAQRSGNALFAWDNYRRFIQSWSMCHDVSRTIFSELMRAFKRRCNVHRKREFNAEQMAELARAYRHTAMAHGVQIPDDPWEQLLMGIHLVIHSWNSVKAREYRRIMEVANDWGTAVVLQRMVFGNLGPQSGSGVLFTSRLHRKRDQVLLWGDYTPGNQGEDIVGGLVATLPVSRSQCYEDGRDPDTSLEHCFPAIYQELLRVVCNLIENHRWNPQEIEFTFDRADPSGLFLLQTRDMVSVTTRQTLYRFTNLAEEDGKRLGRGIGVSGGALCGRAVFTMEQITGMRRQHPDTALILIRYDTVPDDIREIAACDGLLTARGGHTSHASLVAAQLQKCCVVGCENLMVQEHLGSCTIDGVSVSYGDLISIDGRTGLVLQGWHSTEALLVVSQEQRANDELSFYTVTGPRSEPHDAEE